MVTEVEKEILREFKEKLHKFYEIIDYLYPHNEKSGIKFFPNIDSHSDEFLIRAYNLSDTEKVEYSRSKDPEKQQLVISYSILKNIDISLRIFTEKKEKFLQIKQYLDVFQDRYPEIYSEQSGTKIEFSYIDLIHLIYVPDPSTIDWSVQIPIIQERKKKMKEKKIEKRKSVELPKKIGIISSDINKEFNIIIDVFGHQFSHSFEELVKRDESGKVFLRLNNEKMDVHIDILDFDKNYPGVPFQRSHSKCTIDDNSVKVYKYSLYDLAQNFFGALHICKDHSVMDFSIVYHSGSQSIQMNYKGICQEGYNSFNPVLISNLPKYRIKGDFQKFRSFYLLKTKEELMEYEKKRGVVYSYGKKIVKV